MLLGLRDDMETELVSAYKGRCFAHFGHIRHAHGDLNAVHPRFSGSARTETPPSRARFRGVYAAFMFVSGLSASVVRSGIMQLILLFGILLGRQAEPLNSLAVAVLTMSLLNPFCAGDVSPVVLVFGDARHHPACAPHHKSSHEKYSQAAAESAPCKACFCIFRLAFGGAFTAPLQLYLYGTVQFVSVLTSLLALEISAWLLRFGLIAALLLAVPVLSRAPCRSCF